MSILLVFAIIMSMAVHQSANRFEKALVTESNGKDHLISELVTTLASLERDLRTTTRTNDDDGLDVIMSSLRNSQELLEARFKAHQFVTQDAYSDALTLTKPMLDDVTQWLNHGIAGMHPSNPIVLRAASQRIYLVKVQLQNADFAANKRTLDLLQSQAKQVRTFSSAVIILIAGVMGLLIFAVLLYSKNRRAQARLWHERKLTSASLNSINEGFVLTDLDGKVLVVNQTLPKLSPSLARYLGFRTYAEAIASALDDKTLLHETALPTGASREDAAHVEQQEFRTSEGLFLRATNRETDDGGRVITFTDITDLKQVQNKLRVQANYDYLTGIANRSYYVDRLSESLASARRYSHKVALMQFDLDKFKQVNDTLGHAVGDELLITTADRIKRNLRENDLAARIGGDEFAAVLTHVEDETEVINIAERIIGELRQELEIDGAQIDFSASIGVAIFPDHAIDIEALIKHADIACYRAKDSGRNNFKLYGADMKVQALELMTLENKLRKAIERDELYLNYQPQMELQSGSITMVEAFSRWHDNKLGNVSPDRFIPVADKNGLIARLGEQVLEKSFAQMREWNETGLENISVAVNISKRQLFLPNLTDTLDRLSSRYEVSAENLALEITEDVIADEWQKAATRLTQLADRGIKIIIDDYGMGTSSLSRINEIDIYALKIDGAFTTRICTDQSALDVVGAIISSAVNLRIKTIAENVETLDQIELLESIGCSAIQGYYVGAPQSGKEIVTSYMTNREKIRVKKAG